MPTFTTIPRPISFSGDVIYFEIEGDKFTGSGPYDPTESNLSLYCQVWQSRGIPELLAELSAPYSLHNKKAFFDISSLLRLSRTLPTGVSLFPSASHTGIDTLATCQYQIKVSDQYGTPVEAESNLSVIGYKTVIKGASRFLQGFGDTQTDALLHSYQDASGTQFAKEVRKDQPEYIYFFKHTSNDITLEVIFHYKDGTFSEHTIKTISTGTVKVHWVGCSWKQLNLNLHADSNKEVAYYDVRLNGLNSINGNLVRYQIDDRTPDYDNYLLFDNGCGGLEVLRCSGATSVEAKSKKVNYVKPRTTNTNFQDGTLGSIAVSGHEEYRVNTGYYSKEYCFHLRQLILADTWRIDRERLKFYKIQIISAQVKLYDDYEDLHYIEITYRTDDQPAMNSFNA